MTNESKLLTQVNDLGLTIHELLRYGYGGFLAYLVAAIAWPERTNNVIDALGTTISVITAFAIGGVLYIGYRPIVGEILNVIHELVHSLFNRKDFGFTCRTSLLVKRHSVAFFQAPEAFRSIRDSDAFDERRRKRFHKQHSEFHALHITFLVLSIGGVILWATPAAEANLSPRILLGLGFFALISGRVGEILLCRQECKCLLEIDQETIRKILEQGEFVRQAANKGDTTAKID